MDYSTDRKICNVRFNMFLGQLMFFFLFFQTTSSDSGRHSLWLLSTVISGKTPFPEFSAVAMLDDIQMVHVDKKINQPMRIVRSSMKLKYFQKLELPLWLYEREYNKLKEKHIYFKHRFNLTAGVHVHQRIAGCELLENGEPAFIMFRDGSDGQDADSMIYNMTHFTFSGGSLNIEWGHMKRTQIQMLYSSIYLPFCAKTLRNFLDQEKHVVTRRVRPRLRFMTKQVSGGARLTCLATDFYPRHINLTLLRDGLRVDELTGGSVLPNGNGLYQVRKTLTVSDEELRNKHNYTCTAAHLSLDNKLEVFWRAETSRSHRSVAIFTPVGVAAAAVLLLVLLYCRRRRRQGPKGVPMETQESLTTSEGTDAESSSSEQVEPMMSSNPVT